MKYIKGFDSLRAYSIILVLLTHLGLLGSLSKTGIGEGILLFLSGGTGVQIFFTLSGFLITRILIREKEIYGKINFKIFFIRRFLRLLPPLIIFYAAIAALMYFKLIHTTSVGFLFSFFYLYNFVPTIPYYTSELGHTWSLAVEEQFYLIWPLILSYVKKLSVINYLIVIIIVICLCAHYILPSISSLANFRTSRWLIPAISPIMIGSLFSILNKHKWFQFLLKNKFILTISFLLFIFPIYSPSIISELYYILQPIGVSIFLIWILYNQESKLVQLIDNKFLNYIGKISYGLYVYQGLFLGTGPGGNLIVQHFPQNIVLTTLVAIISFEIIEKPILRLKKHFKN